MEDVYYSFFEKPKDPEILKRFKCDDELVCSQNLEAGDWYLGSMGIYIFKPCVLEEMLGDPETMDFGREVIPSAIKTHKVVAHPFTGHWEDIGTIRSYFDAHMAMTRDKPPFPLYARGHQIYTRARNLPPAIVMRSKIKNCIFSEGTRVTGAVVRESIIGLRSIVNKDARLTQVVMLGADYFEGERDAWPAGQRPDDIPPMGIGEGSTLEKCIVDKNARIGKNVTITAKKDGTDFEDPDGRFWIRDGITVIPKNVIIPDNTVI